MLKNLGDIDLEAVELFEITGFNLTDPAETLRFCNQEGVSYRLTPTSTPYPYLPVGVEAEGWDRSGQGALPEPSITITNIDDVITTLVRNIRKNQDFRILGATVTRRITARTYLEGGPDYLDPVRERQPDVFRIVQMSERNESFVRFLLQSPMDLANAVFGGQALRTCTWTYRDPETCNYTGPMFTRDNQPTSDPRLDICSLNLTACEIRHGPGNVRLGGLPGLAQT